METFGRPQIVARLAALPTRKRLTIWGTALLVLSWFVYIYTLAVPGLFDRVGRVKGTDYVQFYVMGSFVLEGKTESLYDPTAHLAQGQRVIDAALHLYASHPNYGPHVALAFAPLAALPWGWSLSLFITLTILCYGVSVWIIWRECSSLQRYGWLVGILAAGSPLLFSVLRYAQTSAFALLFWSVALAALNRKRPFVAGMAIGCLAYKPQMGIVPGVVFLAAGQWRVVVGALSTVGAQLGIAWLATGSTTMVRYLQELWNLFLNPGLVQLFPSEIHSIRGFFQLLIPSPAVVTICFLAGLFWALDVALRTWRTPAPLPVRWGQLVLLSVLASPHLISYDLLILSLTLLVCADWAVRNPDHPLRPGIVLLLVLAYFAPFSGMIVARLTHIQVSVPVFALLAWRLCAICANTPSKVDVRTHRIGAGLRWG